MAMTNIFLNPLFLVPMSLNAILPRHSNFPVAFLVGEPKTMPLPGAMSLMRNIHKRLWQFKKLSKWEPTK
jgi:hypothetical protein